MVEEALANPESIRNIVRSLLRLCRRLCFQGLAANPLEGARGDEGYDQKVPSTEASRIFPSVAIFIGSLKRDIEHRSFDGFLSPDARTHGTMADFLDWL